MPNIKISALPPIDPAFDGTTTFLEAQAVEAGEDVSRKISVDEITSTSSPLNATYITVTPNAILPNERILTGTVNVLSVTDGGAGGNIVLDIEAAAIDNARLADMVQATVKGRADGAGTGVPVDLTASQLNDILASGGFDAYFTLTATDRVIGSNAGTSQTGDNVFLANALAGDNNIADNVIAIGPSALAAAVQLDFEGSIAIGQNAGALLDDTRDPWVIIGSGAVASLPGASFHDGNTVIGTNALGSQATGNMQGNTVIGHDACSDMTGAAGLGVCSSSVVIGFDAGRGTVDASISNAVIIGREACSDLRAGGVNGSVVIGDRTGESLGGASLNVLIGSNNTPNAINIDDSIVLGCNTFGFSGTTEAQLIIGHSSVPGIVTGERNILIGNSIGISGANEDFNRSVVIGQGAGSLLIDDQDIFAIEVPQGTTSGRARPYLFGNIQQGNLALLNIAAMVGGVETGTRIVPAWADAAPVAGQGVFSMYGAGTDLAATTDADFLHFWIRTSDTAYMMQYPGGDTVSIVHNATDSEIANSAGIMRLIGTTDVEFQVGGATPQQIIGEDGQLFINTITGAQDAQGSNIVSATPQKISIFAAGSATNGVDGANIEMWGGYAAGNDPATGGDVILWGGGGGGGPALGGSVRLVGGEADGSPGDVFLTGGVALVGGNGGEIFIAGGAGGGAGVRDGGDVNIDGGVAVGGGAGGDVSIEAGAGQGNGTGGLLELFAGAATSAIGGIVIIRGGSVATSGVGGRIQISPGDGGTSAQRGGDLWLLVGQGNVTGASGNLYINSTDGITAAAAVTEQPGLIAIFGVEGTGVNAGDIEINGGLSTGGATGDGGDILIEGGSSANTNGDGGDIVLTVGTGNGAGVDGQIIVVPTISGSAALPALAFGDGNTGLYESADNILNIATAAAIAIQMTGGDDVALFDNGVEVFHTQTTANGGAEVDAGDGFFRVLNLQNQELRRLDGDVGFATDITPNAVADLTSTLTAAAGEHVIIEGMLRFESTSAVPGVRWNVNVSGAAVTDSSVAWTLIIAGGTVEGDIDVVEADITHAMGANVEHVYKFSATIVANATLLAGISFAQNVSDATTTRMLDGSWVKYSVVP